MHEININFNLPKPWKDKTFQVDKIGYINFLVGANGTGKSQFSEQLKNFFTGKALKCRVLSADRLNGMGFSSKPNLHQSNAQFVANQSNFHDGYNKANFSHYKEGAEYLDTGVDAFIILEEKLDLKIKIEAILSQVMNRDIRLEWDSGKLVPMTYNSKQGEEYEFKKESHGIKELLVVLTHLYDDDHKVLIIDEPELNLHPQYQAFLLEHIRKVAGDPSMGKKIIYLITHSPFILDFQTIEDLKSVICFHSDFRAPSILGDISEDDISKIKKIIPNLNVHHKQLFFADSPIFVEGIFDAQFIKAVQEKRGISLEGSGSTIIDVGGNEQLSSYYLLSKSFDKKAIFLYDLDSIFYSSQLRINAENSDEVSQFLVELGWDNNFKTAWGDLTSSLDELLKLLADKEIIFNKYINTIDSLDNNKSKKEKYALLIYLKHYFEDAKHYLEETKIQLALKKLNTLIKSFENIGIYILENGAMENYFPSYSASKFNISDDKKRSCLEEEIEWIFNTSTDNQELQTRYQGLYSVIEKLPSGQRVNFKKVIESNLRVLIVKIQQGVCEGKILNENQISSYVGKIWNSYSRILTINEFNIKTESFNILLKDLWGFGEQIITIKKDINYANTSFLE